MKKPFLKLSSGLIQFDAQNDLRNNNKQFQIKPTNKQNTKSYDSPKKPQMNQKN